MKKAGVLFCAIVVVLAANVNAETILETFDGALTGWNTTGSHITAAQTAGVSGKYMDITWDFWDATQKSRFSKALSGSYNQNQSMWLEMDVMHGDSSSWIQNGYFAAMNSVDTTNEKNIVGDRCFFAYSSSSDPVGSDRGNRHDAYVYASDGTSVSLQKTNPYPYPFLDDLVNGYRVKFFYDGSAKTIQMAVYAINADGSTGTKQYDSAAIDNGATTASIGTKTFSIDSFGLANRTDKTKQIFAQSMQVDNMYISTTSANTNEVAPSWIPEPATVALLGLGALIFRKRK